MKRNNRSIERRGVAMIVVMMMIAVTLAVSYAMLRMESVNTQVRQNGDRNGAARNAAMIGLAAGVRSMHVSTWAGVGTSLSGVINSTDSYTVSFVAGDDTLSPSSANYGDWHFRVTVVATGKSINPANTQISSTHIAKSTLQLVPLATNTRPTNWSQAKNYTVYQTNTGQFTINVPAQIEGPVRLQGALSIDTDYSWSSTARNRFFTDLNTMRTARNEVQTIQVSNATGGTFRLAFNGAVTSAIAYNASASTVRTRLAELSSIGGTSNVQVAGNNGGPYTVTFSGALAAQDLADITLNSSSLSGTGASVGISLSIQGAPGYLDCRPLTGPLYLPYSSTNSTNHTLVASLGLTENNISISQAMSLPFPNSLSTYRLYTGGPQYTVPQLSSSVSNRTLAPDASTNPLGIYYCPGSVTLGNNVSVQGTLVTGSGLTISGTNIQFTPVDLRPLNGTSTPIRLPLAAVAQTFYCGTSLGATLNGFVVVGQQFQIDRGSQANTFALTGRLITNELLIRRRSEWDLSSLVWALYYSLFNNQLANNNVVPFMPIFMALVGCNPTPTLTIRPDNTSLVEHWQDLSQPIYVKAASDPGLRWDVIRVNY